MTEQRNHNLDLDGHPIIQNSDGGLKPQDTQLPEAVADALLAGLEDSAEAHHAAVTEETEA